MAKMIKDRHDREPGNVHVNPTLPQREANARIKMWEEIAALAKGLREAVEYLVDEDAKQD